MQTVQSQTLMSPWAERLSWNIFSTDVTHSSSPRGTAALITSHQVPYSPTFMHTELLTGPPHRATFYNFVVLQMLIPHFELFHPFPPLASSLRCRFSYPSFALSLPFAHNTRKESFLCYSSLSICWPSPLKLDSPERRQWLFPSA